MQTWVPPRILGDNAWLMLQAAIYADNGYAVLPLHCQVKSVCSCGNRACQFPGEHPRVPVAEASRDVNQIVRWWSQWPGSYIGIATGTRHGLVAVIADEREYFPDQAQPFRHCLATQRYQMPYCRTLYLFSHRDKPIRHQFPNRQIEVRGESGFVHVPPYPLFLTGQPWLEFPDQSSSIAELPKGMLRRLDDARAPIANSGSVPDEVFRQPAFALLYLGRAVQEYGLSRRIGLIALHRLIGRAIHSANRRLLGEHFSTSEAAQIAWVVKARVDEVGYSIRHFDRPDQPSDDPARILQEFAANFLPRAQ